MARYRAFGVLVLGAWLGGATAACSDSEAAPNAAGNSGAGAESGRSGSSGSSGSSGNAGSTSGGTAGTSSSGGSSGSGGSAGVAGTGGAPIDGGSDSGGQAGDAGDSGTGGGPLPPALKWTAEGPVRVLEEIWGSGPQDIYAVGRTGALLHSSGDGTWQTLDAGTGANLTGVWGSGPNDVYVTVDANLILHWTGSGQWERQVLDVGDTFRGIWGSGPDDVYALGPGVMHRSANGWERPPQSVATGGVGLAIWGSSASDIYITCGGACSRKIFHSTGNGTWQGQQAPQFSAADDVWGVDATQVYVAADNYVLFSSGDGTWTIQLTTPGTQRVLAGWAANKDAVYACTQDGFFYRSNGHGAWSEGQEINPGSRESCRAIWGTGPDNIYIGGSRVYHGTPAP